MASYLMRLWWRELQARTPHSKPDLKQAYFAGLVQRLREHSFLATTNDQPKKFGTPISAITRILVAMSMACTGFASHAACVEQPHIETGNRMSTPDSVSTFSPALTVEHASVGAPPIPNIPIQTAANESRNPGTVIHVETANIAADVDRAFPVERASGPPLPQAGGASLSAMMQRQERCSDL